MPISKVKSGSITDSAVTSDKINNSAVTSAKIQDGSIVNADINACAAIASNKLVVDTSALESDVNTNKFNISLLGFKMAVNEGLTVFNLVDGVVDEFNDESGVDTAENVNDGYCATSDFYQNLTVTPACVSAGFTTAAITEPDTSTAGTNPHQPNGIQEPGGSFGQFTVPCGMTSASIKLWGAGGGGAVYPSDNSFTFSGGGGGFTSGNLAVTAGQNLTVVIGEGGLGRHQIDTGSVVYALGGGANFATTNSPQPTAVHSGGGGMSGVFNGCVPLTASSCLSTATASAPQAFIITGGGGGVSFNNSPTAAGYGGAGGGLTGCAGGQSTEQVSRAGNDRSGGGGDQEQGGQGGTGPLGTAQSGLLFTGGKGGVSGPGTQANAYSGGGGGGYYGGGGGVHVGTSAPNEGGGGGGGSSYHGHPQITSGATEEGAAAEGGGVTDPAYSPISADPVADHAGMNEGSDVPNPSPPSADNSHKGGDGYVLITGSYCASVPGGSSTIVSNSFTSNSVATSARIVVFQEDVDTPTLNTDIIASVSRDGTNFTNATLSDSGYVTGSSGQRILTGQADISGQPSGQSMRWKLALANNTVKIHGVSLQWS
jgi:hypothetical protein